MSEPQRLLDRGGNDLATRLLRSAGSDGPDERSTSRALAAVALAAATTSATSGAAAGSSMFAGVLKWLGMGALAGGLVAVSADRLLTSTPRRDPAPSTRSAPTTVAPEAPRGAAPSPPAGSDPVLEPTTAARRSPAPMGSVAAPIASDSARSAPGPSVAAFEALAPPKASLGDELGEVDRARSRLAAGDATGALAELARYEQRFPRGRLRQEAGLLRVEALAASGRCAEARSAASGFLSAHPESVLAKRARTLLARCR